MENAGTVLELMLRMRYPINRNNLKVMAQDVKKKEFINGYYL